MTGRAPAFGPYAGLIVLERGLQMKVAVAGDLVTSAVLPDRFSGPFSGLSRISYE
jgi:hypothetical protein